MKLVAKERDNIRAIELVRQIEAEGRPATKAEQEQLAPGAWRATRGCRAPDTPEAEEGAPDAAGTSSVFMVVQSFQAMI